MKITIAVAPFPIAYKDGLSFAPGAFGWPADGCQRVSISHVDGRPLGVAAFYEVRDALFAELHFDLERVPAGAFPATLPNDPAEARKRMTAVYRVNPLAIDKGKKLITKTEVVELVLSPRDPAGQAIGAMIDARARED